VLVYIYIPTLSSPTLFGTLDKIL